ncbi:hypothetical protein EI200_14070 [Peribacillus simplex]|uniref:hypothetical protein n=1 Tax=Peribacillus simplex TaxID=1478 RepID=UPI000F62F7C3|nr:hypothetical protein [Peribacillus simplex]RRN70592.1 hypothetical protein EI200_14070 [Peribacillus simplex]
MGKDFFEIESKKIKLTDIKSYEITYEEVNKQWIEEVKPNLLVRIILFFASPGTTGVKREIVKSGKRPYDVLIIKTIQGDEYRFSKNEYVFDVQEKVRELNQYLNSK